jgi:AcrR family transcriptional regulator
LTIASAKDRKADILHAATVCFGLHGVRGTRLRDIALDAGVSLTLLDHHFGSKSMLLSAVVEAHHVVCRQGLDALRHVVQTAAGSLSLQALVDAWIDYEFKLYDEPGRAHYLRLLVRLHDDPEVEDQLRLRLHCAEPLVLHGLRRVRPDLDIVLVDAAWLLASASIYAAILNSQQLVADAESALSVDLRHATRSFVLAGLSAYLEPDTAC